MAEAMQLDLLGDQRDHQRIRQALLADVPATRNTDPRTSLHAEMRLRKTGELGKQQRLVLDAITRHPGKTAVELAALICGEKGIPENSAAAHKLRQNVSRRVPELISVDLVKRGKPRACSINHSSQNTYYARGTADV